MPLFYVQIFMPLRRQQQLYETRQKENILNIQVDSLCSRIDEVSSSAELFRKERHDFRHKMHTIAALAEKEDLEAIGQVVLEYVESLPERAVESYTNHIILDAVLFSYLEGSKRKGIRVITKLTFPEELPVQESDLATALANAPRRYIEINSITHPRFMLQVRNSFDGIIVFDKEGVPLAASKGHGFATRSIAAFCDKNSAFYEFGAEGNEFTMRLIF